MKRNVVLIALVTFTSFQLHAQWFYDFGTGTGSHGTGTSTTFLPDPSPGGGNDFVRIGAGSGVISLVNPGSSLGTQTELSATASSTTSANKASIFDYTPGKTFSTRFALRLEGG